MPIMDRAGTERSFRTAIQSIGFVKGHITKLVDDERTTPDLLNALDDLESALSEDLAVYRDCYREPTLDRSA